MRQRLGRNAWEGESAEAMPAIVLKRLPAQVRLPPCLEAQIFCQAMPFSKFANRIDGEAFRRHHTEPTLPFMAITPQKTE